MWFALPDAKAVGAVDGGGDVEMYQNAINIDAMGQQVAGGSDGALWITQVNPHVPVDSGPDMIGRITTKGIWAEYPIASWDAMPQGIVAGPDGAMWFAERHANSIGRITMAGKIKEYVLPHDGSGPTGIALGLDRKLWFTETDGNRIGSIDPATAAIAEYPMPTAKSKPGPIATDRIRDEVGIIELATHRVTMFDTVKHTFENTSVEGAVALSSGASGSIWFLDQTGHIGIAPPTGGAPKVVFPVATQDEIPTAIALGPNGIWFAVRKGPTFSYAGTGGVGYIQVVNVR
jgi:virginiamycin B lyase